MIMAELDVARVMYKMKYNPTTTASYQEKFSAQK
jgi:hypothetical protein